MDGPPKDKQMRPGKKTGPKPQLKAKARKGRKGKAMKVLRAVAVLVVLVSLAGCATRATVDALYAAKDMAEQTAVAAVAQRDLYRARLDNRSDAEIVALRALADKALVDLASANERLAASVEMADRAEQERAESLRAGWADLRTAIANKDVVGGGGAVANLLLGLLGVSGVGAGATIIAERRKARRDAETKATHGTG